MIYEIRQLMRYSYGSYVPVARHLMRLKALSGPALDVLEGDIRIDPAPAERADAVDFFGNGITHFSIREPHNVLAIESRAVVDLKPQAEISGHRYAELGGHSALRILVDEPRIARAGAFSLSLARRSDR